MRHFYFKWSADGRWWCFGEGTREELPKTYTEVEEVAPEAKYLWKTAEEVFRRHAERLVGMSGQAVIFEGPGQNIQFYSLGGGG